MRRWLPLPLLVLAVVVLVAALRPDRTNPDAAALPEEFTEGGPLVGDAGDVARRRRRRGDDEEPPRWQQDQIDALETLGYVDGSELATDLSGVTLHDPERALPGTNLVVSGHGWEALLVDMDGRELHRWTMPAEARVDHRRERWRRAWLVEDGDLLALSEGDSLVRLDRDSQLVWQVRDRNHHDVHLLEDGGLLSLTRKAHVVAWFDEKRIVLDDKITRYDARGRKGGELSILEALRRSSYQKLLDKARERGRDPLHTNSLEVLDGRAASRNPAFAAGNILLSSRSLSALLVIDPKTRAVVWAHRGGIVGQHDAKIVDDGLIMLFDNRPPDPPSAVRLFDPADMEEVWSYRPDGEDAFFSKTCSTAERLDNGNTLVVASNPGIAVEVTPDGTPVWRYHNVFRVGDDRELVANLYDLIRYPPASQQPWLHVAER